MIWLAAILAFGGVDGPTGTPVEKAAPVAQGGDQLFANQQYRLAHAAYELELTPRPDTPELHHRAAVCAALSGDFRGAEAHASRAARLDPGNEDAVWLAVLARAKRSAASERRPPPTEEEVILAYGEGRVRTAALLANEALEQGALTTETKRRLQRLRGRALLGTGRFAEAQRALKTAAALGDASPSLWVDLGDALKAQGERAAARSFYLLALSSAPASGPVARRASTGLEGLQEKPRKVP